MLGLTKNRKVPVGKSPLIRVLMMLIADDDGLAVEMDRTLPLERFVGPFYAIQDSGAEVVLASPKGGFPWIGLARDAQTTSLLVQRFRVDRAAREELTDTLRLEQINAKDFDAAFCVGRQGGAWRDPSSAGALITAFLELGKPVALFPGNLDLTSLVSGNALLIMGDRTETPLLAAHALLSALANSPLPSEGRSP
jgi:hypothetical protein